MSELESLLKNIKETAETLLQVVKDQQDMPLAQAKTTHSTVTETIGWLRGVLTELEIG